MRIQVPKKYRFQYVCCLPKQIERLIMEGIKKAVNELLLDEKEKQEAIENASINKLYSLEEILNIEYI